MKLDRKFYKYLRHHARLYSYTFLLLLTFDTKINKEKNEPNSINHYFLSFYVPCLG